MQSHSDTEAAFFRAHDPERVAAGRKRFKTDFLHVTLSAENPERVVVLTKREALNLVTWPDDVERRNAVFEAHAAGRDHLVVVSTSFVRDNGAPCAVIGSHSYAVGRESPLRFPASVVFPGTRPAAVHESIARAFEMAVGAELDTTERALFTQFLAVSLDSSIRPIARGFTSGWGQSFVSDQAYGGYYPVPIPYFDWPARRVHDSSRATWSLISKPIPSMAAILG